jgi:protoporphyrinogen oxidase
MRATAAISKSPNGRPQPNHVLILGAGPSGLGAGYELSRHGVACTVLDKNDRVGGLARTFVVKGFRFDVGPHRFFTKDSLINELWHRVLGKDFILVPRLTRIYYRNRFFHYPLKPVNALLGLGVGRSLAAFGSYLYARVFYRHKEARSFQEWITFQFGRRLYETFFKTYTEKVWGIPCSEISAEWAAQRIRGLNLWRAIKNAFLGNRGRIRTLANQFHYPRLGAGMLYDRMADSIRAAGNPIHLNTCVEVILRQGNAVTAVRSSDNRQFPVGPDDHLLSSIPITEFVVKLDPPPPAEILEAAREMKYRDHITVNLIYVGPNPFPDNWIYVHSPEVRMARLTNYSNFSRDMVPSTDSHGLGVEYFCFRKDDLWQMSDEALIKLAVEETQQMGLIRPENVRDAFVVREKDSYPTYYAGYLPHYETLKNYVQTLTNVQMIGRGGMFKYNNQDHAALTGLLAARNLLSETHDLCAVNADEEYLEEAHENKTVAKSGLTASTPAR